MAAPSAAVQHVITAAIDAAFNAILMEAFLCGAKHYYPMINIHLTIHRLMLLQVSIPYFLDILCVRLDYPL